MREWYTSAELAGLPGMPTTDRNVRRAATLSGWTSRPRDKGKGLEYHISCLPTPAQAALRAKDALTKAATQAGGDTGRGLAIAAAVDTAIQQRTQEQGLRAVLALSPQALDRADAKLMILDALDNFCRTSTLKSSQAVDAFCLAYNASRADDITDANHAAAKRLIPQVYRPTLYRWRATLRQGGTAALGGNYTTTPRNTIDSQPALRDFIIGMLTEYPHATAEHIHTAARTRFRNDKITLPSTRRLRDWISGWKTSHKSLFISATNPDAWKNKHMLALGDAEENITKLNQHWEADSTPADVELIDGRHCIIGIIDAWSRRPLLLVSKSSKSTAVALALRKALLAWGVPECLKTDNGADYTSRHIVRVLQGLGIEHKRSQKFSGWEKPFIERFFRTFSHGILELLPNYIGHNVADRQALRARQSFSERLFKRNDVVKINMTAADLQDFCDRWINKVYMHREHDKLKCTPLDMLAKWRGGMRSISDERALDVLLAESPRNGGMVTLTKKGITIDGIQYIAPEFGDLDTGTRLEVRHSEKLGLVYVFNKGEFVCIAEAPAYRDIDRRDVAIAAKQKQVKRTQEWRAENKRLARKQNLKNIADEILDGHAEDNRAVVHLPHRKTDYSTDGLQAAAIAAQLLPITGDAASVTALPLSTKPNLPVRGNDPRENHAAWLRVEMRIVQGVWVSPEEREGLAIYKQSNDYHAMQSLFAEFKLNADSF